MNVASRKRNARLRKLTRKRRSRTDQVRARRRRLVRKRRAR